MEGEEEEDSLCMEVKNGSHMQGTQKGEEFTNCYIKECGGKGRGAVLLLTLMGAWIGQVGDLGLIVPS